MSSWRPSASIETLKARSNLMKSIRAFFDERGFLEVDTPILTAYGITDVYLEQFKTHCLGKPYYLQTSPEYPMKRLLAAGSGPIFQLAKVFRDEEVGRWHEPEFTMLEWYQLGIDHHGLMQEMDVFLQATLGAGPMEKITYQAAFENALGFNPHTASLEVLKAAVCGQGLANVLPLDEQDRDQYLFLLLSHVIEPQFKTQASPIALYDFPPSQAALSRIIDKKAARFEVYYRGVELANGFYELTDTQEQARRFEEDNAKRLAQGKAPAQKDTALLAALAHGLPECSGVALGVDRLFALAQGKECLADGLSFAFSCSRDEA